MLVWEWRRIFRQRWRHLRPIPKGASYSQISRYRIITTFVLFFVSWKFLGITFSEKLLYFKDEKTGEFRYHQPSEAKAIVKLKKVELDTDLRKEIFTVKDLTQFPLDDK